MRDCLIDLLDPNQPDIDQWETRQKCRKILKREGISYCAVRHYAKKVVETVVKLVSPPERTLILQPDLPEVRKIPA